MNLLFPLMTRHPGDILAKLPEIAINKTAASFFFFLFTERVDLLKIASEKHTTKQTLLFNYSPKLNPEFFWQVAATKYFPRLHLLRFNLFMKFFLLSGIGRSCCTIHGNTWISGTFYLVT